MTVNKNKRIAIAGLLLLILVLGYWFFLHGAGHEQVDGQDYIYDKTHNISYEEVNNARRPLPRTVEDSPETDPDAAEASNTEYDTEAGAEIDLREIFAEALINSHSTVKYFKHLESKFQDSVNLGDHLEQVRKYLFSEFSDDEARELFETYQKYIECEVALADEFIDFGLVKTPEDAIALLKRIQASRRERLGDELADQLFGADVKAREYAFRRAAIVGDDELYGAEKEERLNALNEDMWGAEAETVESHPSNYIRYRETLTIYEKDLSELPSKGARQEKINEFRNRFFAPEVVERFAAVDTQMAEEEQQKERYREKVQSIHENADLAETDKDVQIRNLQDEIFGDDAEAFRRSETMRIEREKMMEEYEGKGIRAQ